jgi:cytochrome c553
MMKKIFACAVAALASAISFNTFAAGKVEAGKAAAEKYNCFACHGKDYSTPVDPSYPKLAGQHRDYLEEAMIAYKRGSDGPNGRGNAIMGAQVKPLSREDIGNIAAYLNSLPGALVLRK